MYWLMNELKSVLRGLFKLALLVLTFSLGVAFLLAAIAVVMITGLAILALIRIRKPCRPAEPAQGAI